jgi:hypothetical protein
MITLWPASEPLTSIGMGIATTSSASRFLAAQSAKRLGTIRNGDDPPHMIFPVTFPIAGFLCFSSASANHWRNAGVFLTSSFDYDHAVVLMYLFVGGLIEIR